MFPGSYHPPSFQYLNDYGMEVQSVEVKAEDVIEVYYYGTESDETNISKEFTFFD